MIDKMLDAAIFNGILMGISMLFTAVLGYCFYGKDKFWTKLEKNPTFYLLFSIAVWFIFSVCFKSAT